MTVFIPDAADMSVANIRPAGRLLESSEALDDRAALEQSYEDDGYLFFRGLLPDDAITAARRDMMAPMLAEGLIDEAGVWIGGDRDIGAFGETSHAFAGVWPRLFEREGVKPALDKLLGEPATTVPIVQYRAYRPNGKPGGVHQDDFHSPGIYGYKPLWIPLVPMDEAMGGLVLAGGMTDQGFLHNLAKPPRFPVPQGVIPDDAWLWIDYRPGDVLVIHPKTPHVGLPNRSNRVRFSIDTRVESAARPATIIGELVEASADGVTLKAPDGALIHLRIDDETFIRSGPAAGTRLSRSEYLDQTPLGLSLLASRESERALMLRRAVAG